MTAQNPKRHHVFLMAAVYKPFMLDDELSASLPEITAPANYKDPVKIEEYIASATERRNAELGDLWPLKTIVDLKICHFDCYETDAFIRPHIIYSGTETQSPLGELHDSSKVLKDNIAKAHDNHENVQFLGVGIRDILRMMVRDWGYQGLAPIQYQLIADQRDIIDPLGLLDTGEVKKYLDPVFVLRRVGLTIRGDYGPNRSTAADCDIAVQFYNRLCRNGSRPALAMPQ